MNLFVSVIVIKRNELWDSDPEQVAKDLRVTAGSFRWRDGNCRTATPTSTNYQRPELWIRKRCIIDL